MKIDELTTFLEGREQSEFTNFAKAILFEIAGEREEALKIWMQLQTKEAANKTLELLAQVEDDADLLRQLIKKYLKWVLEQAPKTGVDFLTGKFPQSLNLSEQQVSDKINLVQQALSFEESLTFLEQCAPHSQDLGKKDTTTQEVFLEFLTKLPQTPDNLYTSLAEMYIERCVAAHRAKKDE